MGDILYEVMGLGFRSQGLGFRDIIPAMENGMENKMDNDMETMVMQASST